MPGVVAVRDGGFVGCAAETSYRAAKATLSGDSALELVTSGPTITGDVTCADTESSLRGSANVTGSTASYTDFDA